MISFIFARDRNGLIGREGDLPWRLPNDLKFFKKMTTGHKIIMGRKTFESFKQPLPDRINIVVTRQADWTYPGVTVYHSIEAVLEDIEPEESVFCIGGANLFRQFLPHADRLVVTEIEAEFVGDTYFRFDESDWVVTDEQAGETDDKNVYPHRFVIYERKP